MATNMPYRDVLGLALFHALDRVDEDCTNLKVVFTEDLVSFLRSEGYDNPEQIVEAAWEKVGGKSVGLIGALADAIVSLTPEEPVVAWPHGVTTDRAGTIHSIRRLRPREGEETFRFMQGNDTFAGPCGDSSVKTEGIGSINVGIWELRRLYSQWLARLASTDNLKW